MVIKKTQKIEADFEYIEKTGGKVIGKKLYYKMKQQNQFTFMLITFSVGIFLHFEITVKFVLF
jgi:hypothetical protein